MKGLKIVEQFYNSISNYSKSKQKNRALAGPEK